MKLALNVSKAYIDVEPTGASLRLTLDDGATFSVRFTPQELVQVLSGTNAKPAKTQLDAAAEKLTAFAGAQPPKKRKAENPIARKARIRCAKGLCLWCNEPSIRPDRAVCQKHHDERRAKVLAYHARTKQ